MPLRLIRTEADFLNDLATYRDERVPIIEDLLYDKQCLLISADAGVGKSVISEQAFFSLTSGTPLFGVYKIPSPKRCYYLQLEGDYGEYIDRGRLMRSVAPIGTVPFRWDECRFSEVTDEKWVRDTLDSMKELGVEVFFADGFYKLTKFSIASEDGSKAIIRFFDRVIGETGCAIWANHHTHRPKYGNTGDKVDEDDPFYGSQWIKAHVDTSYLMKRLGANRIGLFNKKSRGSDVPKEILLHFDPETFTCFVTDDATKMTGEEKVLAFYKKLVSSGKTSTNFSEVQAAVQVSHAHLRRIQMRHLVMKLIRCDKMDGHKRLWEVIGVVK